MAYIYKITYPNGKIYIGLDWGRNCSWRNYFTYFGSPTMIGRRLKCDMEHLTLKKFSVTKEVLQVFDDDETKPIPRRRAGEMIKIENAWILKEKANDPAIGYNLKPKFKK